MTCSESAKDLLFGELPEAERRALEQHVLACDACREEAAALELTRSALLQVRDEEPGRRIAFVSDKIFEPNWWQSIWNSAPKLGFVSAAMLAAAIVVHGFTAQGPVAAPAATARAVIEDRPATPQASIQAASVQLTEERLQQAVKAALAESESRYAAKLARVLSGKQKAWELQYRADRIAMEEYVERMQKRMNVIQRASYDGGGSQ